MNSIRMIKNKLFVPIIFVVVIIAGIMLFNSDLEHIEDTNGAENFELQTITDEDIAKIADAYNAYADGTLENVKGFCAVVDTEEIAKQDYILTPGRYVGIEEQQEDGEPFEEKMARLTSELSELFDQSHKLEAEIRQKLGAIGYGL